MYLLYVLSLSPCLIKLLALLVFLGVIEFLEERVLIIEHTLLFVVVEFETFYRCVLLWVLI